MKHLSSFLRKKSIAHLLPSGREQRIGAVFIALFCLIPAVMLLFGLITGAATWEGQARPDSSLRTLYDDVYHILVFSIGAAAVPVLAVFVSRSAARITDRGRIKTAPWFYLFGLLLLWSTVSAALSDEPFAWLTVLGKKYCDTLGAYYIYAAFFALGSVLADERTRLRLIRLFIAVNDLLAVLVFLQKLGVRFVRYCFPMLRASVFTNRNHYGYIVCMSVTALFALMVFDDEAGHGRRLLYGLSLLLQSAALIICDTFGCFLASLAAIPFIYLCYFRSGRKIRRRIWLPLVIFCAVIAFEMLSGGMNSAASDGKNFLKQDLVDLGGDVTNVIEKPQQAGSAGTGRWQLWMTAWEHIPDHPLFGYGPEGFNGFAQYDTYEPPHNDLLQTALFLGIPALLLYLAALVTLAVFLWKNLSRLSVTALTASGITVCCFVSSMFGHPLYSTTPFYWLFLGFLTLRDPADQPLLTLTGGEGKTRKEKMFLAGLLMFYIVLFLTAAVRHAAAA